jgi:hypothetical protein
MVSLEIDKMVRNLLRYIIYAHNIQKIKLLQ